VAVSELLLYPEALPLLALVPAVAVLLWLLDRRRARALRRAVGGRTPLLATVRPGRRRTRRLLFSGALLLALLAAMQPAWGEATRRAERRGSDIVVCLDVSRSMLAGDVAPSRLGRAQEEIRALAERGVGDRFALVAFAGEARLLVPLTRDGASFAGIADLAGPLSVARGGTDLGAALDLSLDALKGGGVVLLLTDGEDHEGRGLRAARRARERGVTVHCVGYGTALGAKIPVDGGFLTDRAGNEVVSALDPATLRRLAAAGGGAYADADLAGLYERRVRPAARKAFLSEEKRARENRFQWPLLGAFLLWILDLCVGESRR
jgi:Ca-activated chloride channel family protein